MRKIEIAALAIVLVSFAIGIYLYPQMPEIMASHWNAQGEVDGYIPKFWGLFLMPAISFAILLLFVTIPKIDPLKQNIASFRKYFDGLVLLIVSFLLYLYLITILWAFGFRFDIIQLLVPAFAVLFFYMGMLMEKSKRNWFVGIRTPWTLSNDKVWGRTHKLGSKLMKIVAVIALTGILFEDYAIYLIIVPVIVAMVYTAAYSYLDYRKQERKQ
jgi:uncharacterized membrane protein